LKKTKIIIGRKDIADFEQLYLFGIEVKVDSGAYTSSFHCHQIEHFTSNGEKWVKCNFLDPEHPKHHEKEFMFKIHKIRKVKSSNGMVEERISIHTEITLFNEKLPIELTLTERGEMKYPVLLGRKFISKNFVIDPSRKNLSLKNKKINVQFSTK
jgi:hypothetical protein